MFFTNPDELSPQLLWISDGLLYLALVVDRWWTGHTSFRELLQHHKGECQKEYVSHA
jgi:hypothetical protein